MIGVTSSQLKQEKEKVLCLWEERCLKEVASAGTVASLALRNSVPIYLDHLVEALATNKKMDVKSIFKRGKESTRIGRLHGADRADNRSYELTEVIFEYHILREIIFQVLENEAPLAAVQRDIILDSIEQAVNDAAVEFSEVHTDIQQKFVNTLTHDLKNPITVAKMNAEMILRQAGTPPTLFKFVDRIVGSLNRLQAMIHDLLDVSRIRNGENLALQFAPCDLRLVMREVVAEMSLLHGDRFQLNCDAPVKGVWSGDGIRRAVENLMVNAVKYGAPNSPITLFVKQSDLGIELKVHNEGTPIPEKDVPQLFQYFRRSKSAQEGTQTGWGLGLTLVKGVVDAHQGQVRVESSRERGTSFILEIPWSEKAKAIA